MTLDEVIAEVKFVKLALASFENFSEGEQQERKNDLKSKIPLVTTDELLQEQLIAYVGMKKEELEEEKKRLQEEKVLLLKEKNLLQEKELILMDSKRGLENEIKEMNENMKKVSFAVQNVSSEVKRQTLRLDELEMPPQSGLNKVSASNTDHGMAIYNSLLMTGNIKEASEGTGAVIMTGNLIDAATLIYNQTPRPHEQHLVNLYTPALIEVVKEVNPDLRLVNSEYFQWLRCMSGHRKSDLKPDLFSAYHPLIQYSSPYNNAPMCTVKRLFGKFVSWESRSSIHCIWDAKWKIDMQAFGEKCKYLQIAGEDCFDHNGVALKLKGVLFDKDQFWMIKSSGNTIIEVKKCQWCQRGSKELLIEFLQGNNPWLEATNALCKELGVSIVDYSNSEEDLSAWLGTGANGRVFRLINGQVIKIVLGLKSDEVEKEYLLMQQHYRCEAITSLVFPLVEGSYRRGEVGGVQYAGYLLAQEGQRIVLPVSNELKRDLAVSLCGLHSHCVIHGDPRIENVLILNGAMKWIDFRLSETVTTKISRRRDVEILYKSLGGVIAVACAEIEAYVNDPSVEKLLSVLLK
eukprot:gene6615-7304_t